MWVAAATYCAVLAPKGLLATLIGVLGMAHFSLGRGSGSFCGGFLIGHVGTREAFRYMGLLAVVGGCCYYAIHLLWLKKFDVNVSWYFWSENDILIIKFYLFSSIWISPMNRRVVNAVKQKN